MFMLEPNGLLIFKNCYLIYILATLQVFLLQYNTYYYLRNKLAQIQHYNN